MSNEEILRTPDALLGALDRQRKFLLKVALERCRCPVCGHASNLLEAARIELNAYTFENKSMRYLCPNPICGIELEQVVPLMVLGPRSWTWVRKHVK